MSANDPTTGSAVPDPEDPSPEQAAPIDPQAGGERPQDAVEQPARLLRIASSVQAMLAEVETSELDEAARQRLTAIHNRTVEDLRSVVSGELRDELDELSLEPGDDIPTGAELRVMQAQLSGWLQGLFHGIQASLASQQMAAQQQLARMREQKQRGIPAPEDPGQYL